MMRDDANIRAGGRFNVIAGWYKLASIGLDSVDLLSAPLSAPTQQAVDRDRSPSALLC
jgi:hypothetical protein